jgi:NAD+ diphosphatase
MRSPFDFGPWPPLAYSTSSLDRASERRTDARFIETATTTATTRAVVVGGELIVLRKAGNGADARFSVEEARRLGADGEQILLGIAEDAAWLAFAVAPDQVQELRTRDDLLVLDLRSIAMQGLVPPEQLQPIATAKALLTWHARHRFCANCGTATNLTEAGWRRDCPSCEAQHFPRTDPCVIMLAIDGERCLLGRSARFPPGMWSCLAGFVEPGESFEEAVRRETREETGVIVSRVTYYASQPWAFPMSIMVGCFAEATGTTLAIDRNEIEDARWMPREEAASMLLRKHPDGLTTPPPAAIAHHLIRAYAERGTDVLRQSLAS